MVRNFALLSFGEEAEEDEAEVVIESKVRTYLRLSLQRKITMSVLFQKNHRKHNLESLLIPNSFYNWCLPPPSYIYIIFQKTKGKSKSSHDLLDDKTLSSEPAVEVKEKGKNNRKHHRSDSEEVSDGEVSIFIFCLLSQYAYYNMNCFN